MDRRRKWNEREGNNAEHRWVSDTKENRQIRAGRMWKRMRLTHWRPGPAQSKASARWHSCRTSNPEQRPSLPSRCVVWLSSDHPHAGYGNLRDGRDICGLRLLPITYSLSGAWALFLRPTAFTTLFQLLQLMPMILLMILSEKSMHVNLNRGFSVHCLEPNTKFVEDQTAHAPLSGNKGKTSWTFWDKLDLASLITHLSLDSV